MQISIISPLDYFDDLLADVPCFNPCPHSLFNTQRNTLWFKLSRLLSPLCLESVSNFCCYFLLLCIIFLLPISNLILKSSCYPNSIHATFPLAPWKSGLFMPQGPCMYLPAWNVLSRWLPLARFQYSKHFIYMWNIQKALSKSSSTHPLPISWVLFHGIY